MSAATYNDLALALLNFMQRARNASARGRMVCWQRVRTIRSDQKMCAHGSMCFPRYQEPGGCDFGTGNDLTGAISDSSTTSLFLRRTTNISSTKRWSERGLWSL